MESKILKIDEQSVYKSKIESYKDFDNSFFKDSYIKAANAFKNICEFKKNRDEEDEYNNIIAFLGDRGSGKSSTMKSFKNAIMERSFGLEINNEVFYTDRNNISESSIFFKDYYFDELDTIDPSMFSDRESIVEIIIAYLFKKFKDNVRNDKQNEKRKLIKQFEEVQKSLMILNMDKNRVLERSNDNLENLTTLASAIEMKSQIKGLIDLFLNYSSEQIDSNQKKYLVIAIDDLDMNLAVGEKMLDEIRKYLIQPNVIILMATKYDQLAEILNQKFLTALRGNTGFYKDIDSVMKGESQLLQEYKYKMDSKVERYLEKLIPFNRRCFMPSVDSISTEVKIDDCYFRNIKTRTTNGIELKFLQEVICYNLYIKIDLIIASKVNYENLITKNLRSLIDLIVLLDKMEDIDLNSNRNIFKRYMNESMLSDMVDGKENIFLRDLLYCDMNIMKKKSFIFLNNKIYEEIKRIFSDFGLTLEKYEDNDNYLIYAQSIKKDIEFVSKNESIINNSRITIGDIVTWIKHYSILCNKNIDIKFMELFKTIFSLRLLEICKEGENKMLDYFGVDYFGEYFTFTRNSRINLFKKDIDMLNRQRLNNTIKDYNEQIENNNEYLDNFTVCMLLKPNHIFSERLIRRENKNYFTIEELNDFKLYKYNDLEMVGAYCFKNLREVDEENLNEKNDIEYNKDYWDLKEAKESNEFNLIRLNTVDSGLENKNISIILNLDLWLKLLKDIDEKLINKRNNKVKPILERIAYCINLYKTNYYLNDNIDFSGLANFKNTIPQFINFVEKLSEKNNKLEEKKKCGEEVKKIKDIQVVIKEYSRTRSKYIINKDKLESKLRSNLKNSLLDELNILKVLCNNHLYFYENNNERIDKVRINKYIEKIESHSISTIGDVEEIIEFLQDTLKNTDEYIDEYINQIEKQMEKYEMDIQPPRAEEY